jgi:pimeloyl-ACP methyl ester carboxylesterase
MSNILVSAERRLSYEVLGEQGPLIVAHPGGPGFAGHVLGSLGGLDGEHTLLVIDPRGAGRSEAPRSGRYGLDDYVADLVGVFDALLLDDVVLLGHSHGAMVSARFAASHGRRLRGLVLDTMAVRPADVPFPEQASAYFARFDLRSRRYMTHHLGEGWEPAAHWFGAHERPTLDMTQDLLAITVPTLVVAGERDWSTGSHAAIAQASLLANGEVGVVPDAGHFPWVENPARYVRLVSEFISRLPGG